MTFSAVVSGDAIRLTWDGHAAYLDASITRSSLSHPGETTIVQKIGPYGSFWDRAVSGDDHYTYRCYNDTGGRHDLVETTDAYTVPSAPTDVRAAKTAAGDVLIAWSNTSRTATQIEVSELSGGTWAVLDTVPVASGSYTRISPSLVDHTYRVRAEVAGVFSEYVVSNVVPVIAPPLAPTNLSPDGVADDGSAAISLSWQHNPVDTTGQSAYDVRHREHGSSTWTEVGKTPSTVSVATISAGTYENGDTFDWQVRTWGADPDPSPWSNTAVVPLRTAPIVTIQSPTDGGTVDGSVLTVVWSFYQAEGDAQSAWRATLKQGSATVEVLSGDGTAGSATFETVVADGTAYTVVVEGRGAQGQWSQPAQVVITAQWAPPPTPDLKVTWDRSTGAVTLVAALGALGTGEVAPLTVTFLAIEDDSGRARVVAADVPVFAVTSGGATLPATFPFTLGAPDGAAYLASVTDHIPLLGRSITYRVIATSNLPSSVTSADVAVITDRAAAWVNAGPAFSEGVPLTYDPSFSLEAGRTKTLLQFAGRTAPVEFAGDQRAYTVGVKSSLLSRLLDDVSPEDVMAVADLPAPGCYRDPDGRRVFVSTGTPSFDAIGTSGKKSVSWSLTRVDHTEPTQGV